MIDKNKNLYVQRFGIKLKYLRTKRGLSRRELTERIGCSKSFIAKVEDGIIMDPTPEYKEKFYKALDLSKNEIAYLENNPQMYFYEENNEAKLEISIPKSMNNGGTVSRELLEEYLRELSNENMYVLMYCAQALYNYENPRKVEEDLQDYYKSIGEYDSSWRKDVNAHRSKKIHIEYDKALTKYIKNKLKNGENTLTIKEIISNVKPSFKGSFTTAKVKKLCEEQKLRKIKSGKNVFYEINPKFYQD